MSIGNRPLNMQQGALVTSFPRLANLDSAASGCDQRIEELVQDLIGLLANCPVPHEEALKVSNAIVRRVDMDTVAIESYLARGQS